MPAVVWWGGAGSEGCGWGNEGYTHRARRWGVVLRAAGLYQAKRANPTPNLANLETIAAELDLHVGHVDKWFKAQAARCVRDLISLVPQKSHIQWRRAAVEALGSLGPRGQMLASSSRTLHEVVQDRQATSRVGSVPCTQNAVVRRVGD